MRMQQSYINPNYLNYHEFFNQPTNIPLNQSYIRYNVKAIPQEFHHSLSNSQIYQNKNNFNNPNNWNINQQNQMNVNNFPFGRQRLELHKYVTNQINSSSYEENKKILQKFRIDAIKNRNQRVMKHFGKIPYISQSMMPGSIGASKLINIQQKPPISKPIYQIPRPVYKFIPIATIPSTLPIVNQPRQKFPIVKAPTKIPRQSVSVAVQVNFERQFPLKKKKRHKYYTIEHHEQQQAINKIEDMLHEINIKLKKNSDLLSKTFSQNQEQNLSRSLVFPQQQLKKKDAVSSIYFSQNNQKLQQQFPKVNYSTDQVRLKSRIKTQEAKQKNKSSIKDHLSLIKKNRKRLQDLDQYIYR